MRSDDSVQRPRPAGSSKRAQAVTLIRIGAAVVVLVGLSTLADRARSQGTPYQQYQPMTIPAAPVAEYAQPVDPAAEQAEGEAAAGDAQPSGVSAIFQQIAAGGWLMVPLGICSLVVFSLTLERLIALRRGRVIPRPFVRRFTECVEDGQLSFEEAQQICEEFNCPVAEVFQAAVKRWGRPMMEIEQAVIDAGDRVSDGLTRYLRVFHAISNVAPLIGLLGTVLGMIEAFETMSGGGAVGADLLAAGISTALVTTAGGLFVAIPAYLAYMYFAAVSDRYLNEIDRLCQRVIDCISAEGLESSNRAKKTRRAA
jgi:biopolymer transport protein ExbB